MRLYLDAQSITCEDILAQCSRILFLLRRTDMVAKHFLSCHRWLERVRTSLQNYLVPSINPSFDCLSWAYHVQLDILDAAPQSNSSSMKADINEDHPELPFVLKNTCVNLIGTFEESPPAAVHALLCAYEILKEDFNYETQFTMKDFRDRIYGKSVSMTDLQYHNYLVDILPGLNWRRQ